MNFAEKLKTDKNLITVELSPPKGIDVSRVLSITEGLKGKVDAINVPDCQRSILKMSSLAMSKLIEDNVGIETVWQLTCRDRNVIALQADLIGAYALGIKTVLALTGDPVQVGDHKDIAQQVFHVESTRLLELIGQLNDGKDATGKELVRGGTDFNVGAALNPLRISKSSQMRRLSQKLMRGVDFFQTQPVYSPEPIKEMNEVLAECCKDVGCEPPKTLIGIVPPASANAARFMNKTVAGIDIPESFIELLEKAKDPKLESIKFCADIVESLKPHADGFHFMPVAMESRVSELLDACFDNDANPSEKKSTKQTAPNTLTNGLDSSAQHSQLTQQRLKASQHNEKTAVK